MRLLLVLLGVALVACQTCPPEGGIALYTSQDLSNLPPYHTYYICSQQAAPASFAERGDTLEFNITHGVWRLRGSQVFVDQRIQINVNWPARVDFEDTFFDSLDRVQSGVDNWRGLQVFGSPAWRSDFDPTIGGVRPARTPSTYYGDCGSFDNVGFDNVADDDDDCSCNLAALSLFSCSGRTNVDSVRFFRGFHLLKIVNCTGLILNDVIATHRPDDSAQAGVVISHSQVAFQRPFMNHEDDCMEVRDSSSVTLCYPWFEDGNRTDSLLDPDNKLVVGEGSTVAIAGPNNIYSDQSEVISFEDNGGVVYYLRSCPQRFASGYDMSIWTSYVTGTSVV